MSAARPVAWLVVAALLASLGFCTLAVSAGVAHQAPEQTATPTLIPGTGAVAGMAWDDTDSDGIQDLDELPLEGMLVTAQSEQGSATATSGVDGSYRLIGLLPGLYTLTATPPLGYETTTPAVLNVWVTAGIALTFDFGARFMPTPTSTPTEQPVLDVHDAQRAYCGGIYQGDTSLTGHSNVSRYSCRPAWDESGPEVVFRVELNVRQPISLTLLSASADIDLFLLRYAYPDSCVAAGDTYLTYMAEPGVYFLAVDGYRGAAGAFTLRADCPLGTQASPTPTYTPSPTPTATQTYTPSPTSAPPATATPRRLYLPLTLHMIPVSDPITLVLQQGVDDYSGSTDTTLDSYYPDVIYGAISSLRLFYAQPPIPPTYMAPILRFDIGLLPSAAQIETAQLRLYLLGTPKDADLRGQVHALLLAWDEASATWNRRAAGQAWAEAGAQAEGEDHSVWASTAQHFVDTQRWYDFDVTELVKLWSDDPTSNYGLIVLAQAGDSGINAQANFTSREFDTPELRPQLVISYTLPLDKSP